jgi:poly-gamma-glutamate synthesis protein (capsule biosynthesis protein)
MSDQTRKIAVAATGDSMISRRISVHKESEPVAKIIREADARFTNCEMLFHNCESYPMPRTIGIGSNMCAEPSIAKELAWIGFNIASLCNNHTCDYGSQGIFSTMKALDDAGIVYSGVGRDLDEAMEPKYLETEKGRVALIASCWDPWQERWERASNMKAGIPARPGINLLRVDTQHIVSKESLQVLGKVIDEAKLHPPGGIWSSEREGDQLTFLGNKFKVGSRPGTYWTIRKQDVENTMLSIKDARKSADWVFVSFHSETSDAKGKEYPPDFVCQYARTCIDAGADGFLGHGPHILRGIEIYKKKPIFYSLGNFIAQNYILKKITYDHYEFLGLGSNARPSDFHEARSPPEPPYGDWRFTSIVAVFELTGDGLVDLKLYPVTLGLGEKHRAHIGYPELAEKKHAEEIAERLRRISTQRDIEITYADGAYKVALQ